MSDITKWNGCKDCPAAGPELDDYFYFIYKNYLLLEGGYKFYSMELSAQEHLDLGSLKLAIENKQRSNTAIETANTILAALNQRRR